MKKQQQYLLKQLALSKESENVKMKLAEVIMEIDTDMSSYENEKEFSAHADEMLFLGFEKDYLEERGIEDNLMQDHCSDFLYSFLQDVRDMYLHSEGE